MKFALLFLMLSVALQSLAQSSTLSTSQTNSIAIPAAPVGSSIETTINPPPTKFEDDHQITDNKLKAELGSASKYSMKAYLSYYGPPVGDLSNPKQPNPDGSITNTSTAISGSINARYRFDKETAASFGTGLNGLTPVQGISRFDVRTPTLTYEKVFRSGDWQFRTAPGVSAVTIPEYIAVGEFASLNYDASAYRQMGTTGFRIGSEVSFGYYLYSRTYDPTDKSANQYSLSVFPGVKYTATDRLSISTSLSVAFWNPRANNILVMLNKTLSQRLGIEYSITPEIYVSPYINFYPKSLNANSSTFNISTIFSVM